MDVNINSNWKSFLKDEFVKPYFKDLIKNVTNEYDLHRCYPPENLIFNAFKLCDLENLKVVLLGQDPYHGEGQAHGLAFSVPEGIVTPPSLQNVFKELEQDIPNFKKPTDGNLESWAQQGVLLLNATLSVRAKQAGSHQSLGWEKFTDVVIERLSTEKSNLVFLLWGGFAKKKSKLIDKQKHFVLVSGHPSPLSANRGYWFGNGHFSKANKYLGEFNKSPIYW